MECNSCHGLCLLLYFALNQSGSSSIYICVSVYLNSFNVNEFLALHSFSAFQNISNSSISLSCYNKKYDQKEKNNKKGKKKKRRM